MLYAEIVETVEKLKKCFHVEDPFQACREMGIILLPQPMGLEEDSIKGFYLQRNRIKTITYNDDLPAVLQRIIVAHEFGHSQLHVKSGVHAFHDVGMFNESNRNEKEANLFAAEFLLDDQQVLDSLNSDTTFFAAASTLQVPMELLDFKFRLMKWKGYKLVEPPITARNNFLRDVEVPYGADDSDC